MGRTVTWIQVLSPLLSIKGIMEKKGTVNGVFKLYGIMGLIGVFCVIVAIYTRHPPCPFEVCGEMFLTGLFT